MSYLSCPSVAVCKDGGVEPIEHALDEEAGGSTVHHLLAVALLKGVVEGVVLLAGPDKGRGGEEKGK